MLDRLILKNDNVMESDKDIIERYVNDIIDGKFEFESADVNKGQTGSGIKDAIERLKSIDNDSTGELGRNSKKVLLTYAVRQFWSEFKPMRFFLKDSWEKWHEYLRMRLR